jgi:peptidoglycan hydrolase-like protein with peptidoglycan-binding domain
MVRGERGFWVGLMQAGLVDLGYRLPFSTLPKGDLDGIFGKETEAAVRHFQKKNGLHVDGWVGLKTIREMDAALLAKAGPPPPPPKPAPPLPPSGYALGTSDPPHHADPGAGPWNSNPKTAKMISLKAGFLESWPAIYEIIGPDATKNMMHYMENTGGDGWIDLDKMLREVPSARRRFDEEVILAKQFAETLDPGTYDITSTGGRLGYNQKSENTNWFYAVGGYTRWGKGRLVVADGPDKRQYDLGFDYKFYDRYNWDEGKQVKILGMVITDEFMGEFHREGLAKEYDYYGLARRHFQWKKGENIPNIQLTTEMPVPGGR